MQKSNLYNSNIQPSSSSSPASRQAARRTSRKEGPVILIACLVLAICAVLLIPVLVSGGSPTSQSANRTEKQQGVEVASLEEAAAILGYTPVMPAAFPEGTTLVGYRILDDSVFEAEFSMGKSPVFYRTAIGSEDLSGTKEEYPHTFVEQSGGIPRSFGGASEKKLHYVVWADKNNSYAIVCPAGIDGNLLKEMALSVF